MVLPEIAIIGTILVTIGYSVGVWFFLPDEWRNDAFGLAMGYLGIIFLTIRFMGGMR